MVSEACCNRDRTQAVFPEPVIPAIMEVKGCSNRNRWHFCENGTVWNGVRPTLWCLDITCLCMLSFLLNDFSQTEQNQLMSAPQEQNVDWENGSIMRIDIVLKVIKLNSFPPLPPLSYSVPPPPPPPHLYCFPSTTTTTTATTFLLFSLHHHHYHHHISIVFLHHHHRHQHHHISIVFLHHHHHHHISIVLLHDSQYKTANYYDKFSLSQCLKLSRTVVVFFNS